LLKKKTIQYEYKPGYLQASEPNVYQPETLADGEMILNLGPQHPSTHGVLRLEIVTDGEVITQVVPHIGYLHRCFEKHAEALPFNQIIPYVDRMDYLAAMNCEHVYVMGVEKLLGIDGTLPKRVEYIRVLVCELNRLASHFVALGTYAMDLGAFTPFLWMMRDREHILRMLEWASGARMLYNYIWVGGLFYDLPLGFESKCRSFIKYLIPKLVELQTILTDNKIFVNRTANVGVLPLSVAINYGVTGPMLRASGLAHDLRKANGGYSVYNELEFEIPTGEGWVGTQGDCFDRTFVRVLECYESARIISQCLDMLENEHKRTKSFNPQAFCPKKIRPSAQTVYVNGETPRGELGYFFKTDGKSDIPFRCKARAASFCNLSVIEAISKGALLADLIAILGSVDIVLGDVDR
jgi:NADH-quinone oxidoreductase subunit D